MKPYLISILFFLTPFFACTPSTDTALLHGDIPTVEGLALKGAACGLEYNLDCPGTKDCYYGNNLDTYLDTCEQGAFKSAWMAVKAGTLVGVISGAAGGAVFFGVGAAPGAIAGGLTGFVVGSLVGVGILWKADSQCQNRLSELCATCQTRQ